MLSHQALQQWHQLMADALNSKLAEDMASNMVMGIKQWLALDTAVALLYPSQQAPVLLFDDYPEEKRQKAVISYTSGLYLLDPFYNQLSRELPVEPCHFADFAPDNFAESEYYQLYYKDLDLADELAVFAPIDNNNTLIISIAKRNINGEFSQEDLERLNIITPLIKATAKQYYLQQPSNNQQSLSAVANAFEHFGNGLLSKREQQIAQLVLQGHSSKSLARALDISPSTVKVHRKHIYERLGINTQAELFNYFLLHLETLDRC